MNIYMSLSRNQLNKWLIKIDITGKSVLDVGAGEYNKWAMNFVRGKPKEYVTLDIDKRLKSQIVADLNKRRKDFSYGEFDIIFCLETLEHCWDPVQVVKNLFNMLDYNGICYISTPFINPHHDKWDYLRFTGEWFYKILKRVGFREIIIKERVATEGKDLLRDFYQVEGLRVSKIRSEYGQYTYPIGYMVKAVKG